MDPDVAGVRRGRKWTIGWATAAGAWLLAGWVLVPAVIKSAYSDGLFGFLGGFMSGREVHDVGVYLGQWSRLVIPVLTVMALAWLIGAVLMQPATWRFVRRAYLGLPTFAGRFQRRTVALALAVAAIMVTIQAIHLPDRWETAEGNEYEFIATSIVNGDGFSFPPYGRWLVLDDEPGADQPGATAWKEPFYPYFMAAAFKLFGDRYGRLAIVLAQLGFLFITSMLIYRLGTRLFGPGIGIAAALLTVLLLDLHWIYTIGMATSAISGLLLVGGLLLLFRYGDQPSTRRALWMGFYFGLAALTHAVLVVMVPIAGLFILLHSGERPWHRALKPAVLMGVVAALTISPWTVRNYVQFGHLIPVQTGFGLFANMSNPYVAETYLEGLDACGDGSPKVYRSDGPVSALRALREDGVSNPTHRRATACIAANHADVYLDLNEHERDGLHKAQFIEFVKAYPAEFLALTVTKTVFYLFDVPVNGRGSLPLGVAAVAGLVLVARRPRMWVFPLAILAYTAPFALTSPVFYRYQAPIEPLYALFAVVAVVTILGRPVGRLLEPVRRLAAELVVDPGEDRPAHDAVDDAV